MKYKYSVKVINYYLFLNIKVILKQYFEGELYTFVEWVVFKYHVIKYDIIMILFGPWSLVDRAKRPHLAQALQKNFEKSGNVSPALHATIISQVRNAGNPQIQNARRRRFCPELIRTHLYIDVHLSYRVDMS